MQGKRRDVGWIFCMLLLALWGAFGLYLAIRNPLQVESISRYALIIVSLASEAFFILWIVRLVRTKRK